MRRMPRAMKRCSISRMPARVEPMQERCGAAWWPSAAISITVASVLARRPPAP
jgi:hypothetical protein